jgi:uncharacterized protein YlxP (DUF503 family)
MVVGSLRLTLRLHGCSSLKEKRSIRRRIGDRVRNRFKVAVAEVAHQDVWTLLEFGVATVGPDRGPVERVLRDVVEFVDSLGLSEIVGDEIEIERR